MHLAKRFAFVLAFVASRCFAKITISKSEPEESGLIEAAIRLMESCYGNRATSLGLAGNSTAAISRKLSSRSSFSVTLVDPRIVNTKAVPPQFRHKLQLFLVLTSSSTSAAKTLKDIKSSTWWNHMAVFLMLAWPPSSRGCSNAYEILWSAWELNILDANLMCRDQTNGLTIYTFNPYMPRAPVPWQFTETYRGTNEHPWTLFSRRYEEGAGVCKELNFEKANDLGGYEFRISVTDTSYEQDLTKNDRLCVGLYENIFCEIFLPALNVTPKVLAHSSMNAVGSVDGKGNASGILGELINGLSDIGFTSRFLTSLPNLTAAYPYRQEELSCLTQYSGYKSQLSKISSVVDSNSEYGLYLVCLITILFFITVMRQSITVALLSTLRIICNGSLPDISVKLAPRIYLGSLFLFALTMQGIYQGRLASLLTMQEPLRNVNTMRDLIELGHTIYGATGYRANFDDSEFDGRYVEIRDVLCADYVPRNPRAACVGAKIILVHAAAQRKLHLSRESLAPMYLTFPIRPDWPLEQRFNDLLFRSIESRVIQHLHDGLTLKTYRLLESQENEIYDHSAKVLTLDQLDFAFVTLGIGLGCATVIFVVEVVLGRASTRRLKIL